MQSPVPLSLALEGGGASLPCSWLSVVDNDRLAIRYSHSVDLVASDDLVLARADRNVSHIVTRHGEHRVRASFADVVSRLAPFGMVRIHRGLAVNVGRVRRLAGRGQHRLYVVLDTGLEVLVGRAFQSDLRQRLGGAARVVS